MDPLRELARFDPGVPLPRATTPPASWYTEPAFLELEHERLFRRSWQPLALAERLVRPGDFEAGRLGREPLVAVRGGDGALRVLRNVCLHHAAEVASGSGHARRLVCPYHGWSYELDGRLAATPRCEGMEALAPGEASLAAVPARRLGPLVLAVAGGAPLRADPVDGALERRLAEAGLDGLRFVRRRTYELRCNWKVFVDNYLDGGYHVAPLHRDLGAQLDAASYRTQICGDAAVQSVGAAATPAPSADLPERVRGGALYVWVHPNLMLNRYGPFLDTNHVVPVAADRCRVVFDWFVEPDAPELAGPEGETFLERCLAASDAVQREDEAVCESVQRGLASSGYDRGRYAPRLEHAAWHFHRLLARDLGHAG